MSKAKENQHVFRLREDSLGDVCLFVEGLLMRRDVSDEAAKDTLIVFEALVQKLVDWGLDEDADLQITGVDRLGDFRIKVGFEGKLFVREDDGGFSIEDRLLDAYDDRIEYRYHSGYNWISIAVSRSSRTTMFACMVATLLAVIVYLPLSSLVDADGQLDLLNNYVFPLETMYGNALLMIGAPMTFFSLLKNMTDTYVVSQRSSGIRQLQLRTLGTSVFAILLALVAALAISVVFLSSFEGASSEYGGSLNRSFADVVTSLVPPSIFEPFEAGENKFVRI